MLTFEQKGNLKKTYDFLRKARSKQYEKTLSKYGERGVLALAKATPVDTGKTANSWSYEITYSNGETKITWNNSNSNNGVPIAILIQYGHIGRNGAFVQGIDYINPALKPIFESMSKEIWASLSK